MTRYWTIWIAVLIAIILMDAVITYIPRSLSGFWFVVTAAGLMVVFTYVLVKTWDFITAKKKTLP